MSTLKADAVTSAQDNTALTLSGTGTGGVKVNDFFIQAKGADIASDTALTLGKDGNQFDVTGTTTITSIATQGIGSYVTLHFDGILTFTHHSTNLILPGAASITTAAGDIAVMYEYASADWRCVSYTKASGAAVVAGGFTLASEQATTSGTSITFSSIPAGTTMINIMFDGVSTGDTYRFMVQIGDSGGLETSGYLSTSCNWKAGSTASGDHTVGFHMQNDEAADAISGTMVLTLEDSSNFTWTETHTVYAAANDGTTGGGRKALSAELTQLALVKVGGSAFDAGAVNISYL